MKNIMHIVIDWKEIVKILLVVKCILALKTTLNSMDTSVSREKRYLMFPDGLNVIQLIIGIGVPVEVKPESIIFGWAFRAFYTMPTNISQLMPMDYGSSRRHHRAISRWDIYKMFEVESEYRGLGGRPCVLQSICEVSDIPFDKYSGLFEELFHSIFTPTSTNEEIGHHTDNEYFAAQNLGRKYRGKCRQLFPGCKHSLIEMFTYTLSENNYFM